jgi:hypothetical protein
MLFGGLPEMRDNWKSYFTDLLARLSRGRDCPYMSGKTAFETYLPEGIYVYSLSDPLTFVGLSYFVTAIIEDKIENPRVVIMNIDKNALAFEGDLAAVDSAAGRLLAHAILPLLVVPEGWDHVNRYCKPTTNIGTFKSMRGARNCAMSFVAADISAEKEADS